MTTLALTGCYEGAMAPQWKPQNISVVIYEGKLLCYDDYDDHVGLPNCDKGEPGSIGAEGKPDSDQGRDGAGAHSSED